MALEGLKVLDFTSNLPGPYAAMVLADLGASVIKVENPSAGDPTRAFGSPNDRDSPYFLSVNRSKQSLAVNLKSPEGRRVILDLLADGWENWLEGSRPGVMARLGLDHASLSREYPRLICVSITGYGQHGPLSHAAGHDAGYLARSGLLYASGAPGGPPALPAVQAADLAGGALPAVAGLLAAVIERQRTGRGRLVDVAMCDSLFSLGCFSLATADTGAGGPEPGDLRLTGRYPCYRVYPTSDGRHVVMAGLEEKFWVNLVTALDRPDLLPRQYDPGAVPELAAEVAARDFAWWREFADRVDCCLEPVLTLAEARTSEQARARGLVCTLADPRRGPLFQSAPLLPDLSPTAPAPPPVLGEHTAQILAGLGYSDQRIQELASQGAVRLRPDSDRPDA